MIDDATKLISFALGLIGLAGVLYSWRFYFFGREDLGGKVAPTPSAQLALAGIGSLFGVFIVFIMIIITPQSFISVYQSSSDFRKAGSDRWVRAEATCYKGKVIGVSCDTMMGANLVGFSYNDGKASCTWSGAESTFQGRAQATCLGR